MYAQAIANKAAFAATRNLSAAAVATTQAAPVATDSIAVSFWTPDFSTPGIQFAGKSANGKAYGLNHDNTTADVTLQCMAAVAGWQAPDLQAAPQEADGWDALYASNIEPNTAAGIRKECAKFDSFLRDFAAEQIVSTGTPRVYSPRRCFRRMARTALGLFGC